MIPTGRRVFRRKAKQKSSRFSRPSPLLLLWTSQLSDPCRFVPFYYHYLTFFHFASKECESLSFQWCAWRIMCDIIRIFSSFCSFYGRWLIKDGINRPGHFLPSVNRRGGRGFVLLCQKSCGHPRVPRAVPVAKDKSKNPQKVRRGAARLINALPNVSKTL